MVTHEYEHSGQQVKIYYEPTGKPAKNSAGQEVSTSYTPKSTKTEDEKLDAHVARRAQNRALRDKALGTKTDRDIIEEYDDAPLVRDTKPAVRKTAPAASKGGSSGFLDMLRVGAAGVMDAAGQMPEPTWLKGGGGKKRKGKMPAANVTSGNLPDWVLTGRAPWDAPARGGEKPVAKIITTRVHADGTRHTTTRIPSQRKQQKRPNWIRY